MWITSSKATEAPKAIPSGTAQATAQKSETLPKWWCQKLGRKRGKSAMERRMPANGMAQGRLSSAPFMPSEARARPGRRRSEPRAARRRVVRDTMKLPEKNAARRYSRDKRVGVRGLEKRRNALFGSMVIPPRSMNLHDLHEKISENPSFFSISNYLARFGASSGSGIPKT